MKKYIIALFLFIPCFLHGQNIEKPKINFYTIQHASFVIKYKDKTIVVDPTGNKEKYSSFIKPDIILITHEHYDHFDSTLIKSIKSDNTTTIGPKGVIDKLNSGIVLNNNDSITIKNIKIEAIPMYNITPERMKYHKKGNGNGYVVTIDGERIYISGDTEDIPEIRALKNIDHAFICMNLPYTMSIEQAASLALEMKPKNVYPYHYRTEKVEFSDIYLKYKTLLSVDKNIRVIFLKWYDNE